MSEGRNHAVYSVNVSTTLAYSAIAIAVVFWLFVSLSFLGTAIRSLTDSAILGLLATALWIWVSYPLFTIGQWLFNWKKMLGQERAVVWISDVETDITGQDDALRHYLTEVAHQVGLPKVPDLGVNKDMNAFAFGYHQENSVVVIGRGLLDTLSEMEIKAVLAHELGHIQSSDSLVSSAFLIARHSVNSIIKPVSFIFGVLGVTFAGVGAASRDEAGLVFSLFGLILILALIPLWVFYLLANYSARLADSFHSRQREYRADRVGATATTPDTMISALTRLHEIAPVSEKQPDQPLQQFNIVANNATGDGMFGLFATHPSLSDRIKALEALKVSSSVSSSE